jgi:hypothetical protein
MPFAIGIKKKFSVINSQIVEVFFDSCGDRGGGGDGILVLGVL